MSNSRKKFRSLYEWESVLILLRFAKKLYLNNISIASTARYRQEKITMFEKRTIERKFLRQA